MCYSVIFFRQPISYDQEISDNDDPHTQFLHADNTRIDLKPVEIIGIVFEVSIIKSNTRGCSSFFTKLFRPHMNF